MSTIPSKVAMAPPHPGEFIRHETLSELGLSVRERRMCRASVAPRFPTWSTATRLFSHIWRCASRRRSAWSCCCGCRHGAMPPPCADGRERSTFERYRAPTSEPH
jgi:hypothetical protein